MSEHGRRSTAGEEWSSASRLRASGAPLPPKPHTNAQRARSRNSRSSATTARKRNQPAATGSSSRREHCPRPQRTRSTTKARPISGPHASRHATSSSPSSGARISARAAAVPQHQRSTSRKNAVKRRPNQGALRRRAAKRATTGNNQNEQQEHPPLLAFAGARARKGFSRCRSSGARAQEAATAEPAAPLPRPAVQLKDLAGGLLPGERSSGFPVADGGADRLVVGGTRFRERGARHDGRRSGRRAGRKGQAPQRQCQPPGAAPPPGAKGKHTASARGGHPAPQPTGDAGEGAPSGGGGARRGRTRDKTQKLPPVFWFFPCFFLLFL